MREGTLAIRPTGEVLGRVVETFVRSAPEVIDAEIAHADGTRDTLTGTPNHPFWVDAVRDYVPLGELEVGTVLHVQGGGDRSAGRAILVSKTWRQGDFEVFDFEVEGLHNFYVRGEGGDAVGVLVHNSTGGGGRALLPDFDDFQPGQGFSGAFDPKTGNISMKPSSADPNFTPDGFAPRNGGHLDVAEDLIPGGGAPGELQGFTGFLEEGGGLRLEYASGGLNGPNPAFPGRDLPESMQGPLRDAVGAATGRTVQ